MKILTKRPWIPISYVNKFCPFNMLTKLFVFPTTVSWSRELHLFFVRSISTDNINKYRGIFNTKKKKINKKTYDSSFISFWMPQYIIFFSPAILFPLKYIWIKMYKFGEWYVVALPLGYCFTWWWYEKISIQYINKQNTHHHIIIYRHHAK